MVNNNNLYIFNFRVKKFIINSIIFFLLTLSIFSLLLFSTKNILKKGKFYSIDSTITSILLGHSHASDDFNDSLIEHFRNFGSPGESYYYSYFKAKKLIENNTHINTVFIVYTNNQINARADKWIWSEKYLNHTFPKYSAFIGWSDYKILLFKNWQAVLNSECLSLKQNLYFLLKSRYKNNYMDETDWGKFSSVNGSSIDLLGDNDIKEADESNKEEIAKINIQYLIKTIAFFNTNHIKTYLIRCPLHPNYKTLNEIAFKQTLDYYHLTASFMDFKDYPLNNDAFLDLEHLNVKGANEFSIFFSHLLKDKILEKENRNDYIIHIIDSLKVDKHDTR